MTKRRMADEDASADDYGRALSDSYRAIFAIVQRIPRGQVMTYGQVAEAAGLGRAARLVGYAMHAIGMHLPWHRVLGMRGRGVAQVSIKDPIAGTEQRQLLEQEGVQFSGSSGVDLDRFGANAHSKEGSRTTPPRKTGRSSSR